jgi:hypothetical protein
MPFKLLTPGQEAAIAYLTLFLLVAPLFPFLYLVLRWRAEGRHEPGMGTHGALLYFAHASFLLLVAGVANLCYGFVSTTEIQPFLERLSWGLVAGSGAFLGVNIGLLRYHRAPAAWRDDARLFRGFLMVMSGLVSATTLVLFCVTFFHEPETPAAAELAADDLKLYGSWAGLFLATFIGCAMVLRPRAVQ